MDSLASTSEHEIKHGCALEIEGFMFRPGTEDPVTTIEIEGVQIPAAEAAQILTQIHIPKIARRVSLEQHCSHFEMKTRVHRDTRAAAIEALEMRDALNKVLRPREVELRLQPVIQKPYEFSPATRDRSHRAYCLMEEWGKEDPTMLPRTALAVLQYNDSRPFADCKTVMEVMERARLILNAMDEEFKARVTATNTGMVSGIGETRQEMLEHLIPWGHRKGFDKRKWNRRQALHPPHFETVNHLMEWSMAMSNEDLWENVDLKDGHSYWATVKGDLDVRRDTIHHARMESRATDCGVVDGSGNHRLMTVDDLLTLIRPYQELFERFIP